MSRDLLDNSVDRRGVLKSIGTAIGSVGTATTGLSTSVSGRTMPSFFPKQIGDYSKTSGYGPVYDGVHSTRGPTDVHLSSAVERQTPKKLDVLNGAEGVVFTVSAEAATTGVDRPNSFVDRLDQVVIKATFPHDNVFANDSKYWVAAMDNYRDPEQNEGSANAFVSVISYAMGFAPYPLGKVAGAVSTAKSLRGIGSVNNGKEKKKRNWYFDGVKRANSCARFVAEVYPNKTYNVEIETWARSSSAVARNNYTLEIGNYI